jgi:hypothetical protein
MQTIRGTAATRDGGRRGSGRRGRARRFDRALRRCLTGALVLLAAVVFCLWIAPPLAELLPSAGEVLMGVGFAAALGGLCTLLTSAASGLLALGEGLVAGLWGGGDGGGGEREEDDGGDDGEGDGGGWSWGWGGDSDGGDSDGGDGGGGGGD